MEHRWLTITKKYLEIEKEQIEDEGKDTSSVDDEFDSLLALDFDDDRELQPRLKALLEKTAALPMKEDYPFVEPSDLEGIRNERPAGKRSAPNNLDDDDLFDKVLGAWQGRCSGCLLGKPVEGWRSDRMWGYLKDLDRFPLDDYFTSDVPEEIAEKYDIRKRAPFIDRVDHMPIDDDTNYTVTGFALMKQYGKDFTPENVAEFWLKNIPLLSTCTAERAAYRNLALQVLPPQSATHWNVYREWIGAQIRADYFGYAALGNPELAAEFAWRDESISHIKNGIYGEMWVSAMIAIAPFEQDVKKIIEAGLAEVPQKSRLTAAIRDVVGWHEEGVSYAEGIERIHQRWDEHSNHHWCHTISNAQVVALGLLWSEDDFEKAICRAVEACFDTDCNGATVGSIMGMKLGAKNLPEKWIGPLNDRLDTSIAGYNEVRISEIAKEGFDLYKSL